MAHVVPGPAGPPPLGPDGFPWTAWPADPTVVGGLLILGAAYGAATLWRRRLDPQAPVEADKIVSFAGALGVLATITVVRVARVEIDARRGTPPASTIAALVLGAWLLVAPQTWSWVGVAELTDWRTAVVLAAVGAAAGAFAVASFTDLTFSVPALDVADPVAPAGDGRVARLAAPVALVALAVCGVVLVASSVS